MFYLINFSDFCLSVVYSDQLFDAAHYLLNILFWPAFGHMQHAGWKTQQLLKKLLIVFNPLPNDIPLLKIDDVIRPEIRELQALYLSETYCQKTSTRPPCCTTPREPAKNVFGYASKIFGGWVDEWVETKAGLRDCA